MSDKSFVKLFKKFTQWEWYDDINTKVLFIHLLLTVNWKDGKWHGVDVPRGSKITSYAKLSSEIGISIQQTRTAISNLQSTQEITVSSTHTYTMINVLKYGTYQINEKNINTVINTDSNEPSTSQQQASNMPSTTIEEIKEVKELKNKDKKEMYKEKIPKKSYGEFNNVSLSDEEFKKLESKNYTYMIERLSSYLESTGKTYKSHYATILSWCRKEDVKNAEYEEHNYNIKRV